MTTKRVILIRNGENYKKVVCVQDMKQLLEIASNIFEIPATKLFTAQGAEIDDTEIMRDNELIYVSMGESFIYPNKNVNEVCSKNGSSNAMDADDTGEDWIWLNVGGQLFLTTRHTLILKHPNSTLANIVNCHNSDTFKSGYNEKAGAYLIDRSPTYFAVILEFLRSGEVILDFNVNPYGVLQEARYFGIDSMIPELEKLVSYSQRDRDNVPLSRYKVINKLISTTQGNELRFQGVNLAGADLSRLDLSNINFKYANLKGCRLEESNLNYCNFERADISNAVLDRASLAGVKMNNTILENSQLRNCNFEDRKGSRPAILEHAKMKNADLEGSHMENVSLRLADLRQANLKYCSLKSAILAGANLENCDLTGSDLLNTNLRGANLTGASLELMQNPIHMSQLNQ